MAKKYTKDEAVDIILDFKKKYHVFPLPKDYEKMDVHAIAKALGVDIKARLEELGIRAYAVINIAVLRELRRRNGQIVYIADKKDTGIHYFYCH